MTGANGSGDYEMLKGLVENGKDYRAALVASHTKHTIARQIRELRTARALSQKDMYTKFGIQQSSVSEYENPSKANPTIKSLVQYADAFDVALLVRFVDFKTFLRFASRISKKDLVVPPYVSEARIIDLEKDFSEREPSGIDDSNPHELNPG